MDDTLYQMTERFRGIGWRGNGVTVCPTPGGNPICRARDSVHASWIARRLRDADIFEAKVAEQRLMIDEQRDSIKRLASQLRASEKREQDLRAALQRDEVMSRLDGEPGNPFSLSAELQRNYEEMEGLREERVGLMPDDEARRRPMGRLGMCGKASTKVERSVGDRG